MERFGPWTKLRVLRERSDYSINELATRAGLSRSHLSNLENGMRWPSPSTVIRLAEALGVPVDMIERRICDPTGGLVS